MRFSCNSPTNVASSWFSTNNMLSNESAKFPSTNASISSFLMFLFSMESTNILALLLLRAFLVFRYCDHRWRLDNCPLQLYNCSCHASNGTSPVSRLNINLLLGFSLSLSLDNTLTNSSPESMYSARSRSGLMSKRSLLIRSIVFCENVPSLTSAVNSCIQRAIAFKSSGLAFKCQYPP